MVDANPSTSFNRRTLRCVVVTPEATVVDTTARFVALPLYDGEAGIAPLHSPMIGRLGYGELRIDDGAQTDVFYVDGGFVQVSDDVVSIITNRSIPAAQVNLAAASEQLASAQRTTAVGEDEMAVRDRKIAQARAQLRVARRAT